MGTGTDGARAAGSTIHADVIDNFKDQLLVCMLKRLKGSGNTVVIPVAEVDATGDSVVSFQIVANTFRFVIEKKQ